MCIHVYVALSLALMMSLPFQMRLMCHLSVLRIDWSCPCGELEEVSSAYVVTNADVLVDACNISSSIV